MTRGFVIVAIDTPTVKYSKCAEALVKNINNVMPNASVTILDLPDLAPNSDWKLINDWQVYNASPYDETIKLEADMYLPRSIEHWFDALAINDVAVCNKIRNYKGEISGCKWYRGFIEDNKLPDVYNAITYFKKSKFAEDFFKLVRNIFENWEEYKKILTCNKNEPASTDWVYAIACHIMGIEKTTVPYNEFSFIHMKQFVNDLPTENWTESLIYEVLPHSLRIQTYPQNYPFHYHIKEFSNILLRSQ